MITKDINTRIPEKKEPNKPVIRNLPSGYVPVIRALTGSESVGQSDRTITPMSTGVFIKVDSRYKKILSEDIYLIEALSDYMILYTKEKRYTIHCTLHGILEKLSKTDFMRVHKSYIVRIESISAIEDNLLTVEDQQVPIGKTFRHEVMSRLNIFA